MFINGQAGALFEEENITKWKRMYSGLAPQTVNILGINSERVHDEQIAQIRTDMRKILKENWKRIRRLFLLSISKTCSELTKWTEKTTIKTREDKLILN
jgi:hypothetical protein